jgi:hypothetical protein
VTVSFLRKTLIRAVCCISAVKMHIDNTTGCKGCLALQCTSPSRSNSQLRSLIALSLTAVLFDCDYVAYCQHGEIVMAVQSPVLVPCRIHFMFVFIYIDTSYYASIVSTHTINLPLIAAMSTHSVLFHCACSYSPMRRHAVGLCTLLTHSVMEHDQS